MEIWVFLGFNGVESKGFQWYILAVLPTSRCVFSEGNSHPWSHVHYPFSFHYSYWEFNKRLKATSGFLSRVKPIEKFLLFFTSCPTPIPRLHLPGSLVGSNFIRCRLSASWSELQGATRFCLISREDTWHKHRPRVQSDLYGPGERRAVVAHTPVSVLS